MNISNSNPFATTAELERMERSRSDSLETLFLIDNKLEPERRPKREASKHEILRGFSRSQRRRGM